MHCIAIGVLVHSTLLAAHGGVFRLCKPFKPGVSPFSANPANATVATGRRPSLDAMRTCSTDRGFRLQTICCTSEPCAKHRSQCQSWCALLCLWLLLNLAGAFWGGKNELRIP